MKIAIIHKSQQERFNLKRGWFVNAFTAKDADTGQDISLYPFVMRKKELIDHLKAEGYTHFVDD